MVDFWGTCKARVVGIVAVVVGFLGGIFYNLLVVRIVDFVRIFSNLYFF